MVLVGDGGGGGGGVLVWSSNESEAVTSPVLRQDRIKGPRSDLRVPRAPVHHSLARLGPRLPWMRTSGGEREKGRERK